MRRHVVVGTLPAPAYPPDYGAVGSYEPSAATTGVPSWALSGLTRYDGNITLTTPGTVLEDLDIYGKVSFQAADCTMRRCIARGITGATTDTACIDCGNANVVRAVVEDVLLDPQQPSRFMNGIQGHDFTIRRTEIRNVVDYIDAYNTHLASGYQLNVVSEQNYMHDMTYWTPDPSHTSDNQSHNDGIQIHGGMGFISRGDSIWSYYGPKGSDQPSNVANPTPSGWTSPSLSCVLFNVNVGTTGGHIFEDSWLRGAYLPVNCGGAPGVNLGRMWRCKFSGDSFQPATGAVWTINRRSDQTFDCGEGTENENTFLDGTPITVRNNG